MSEPEIIFEDENFLAINKPAGLMVHAAKISPKRTKQMGVPRAEKEWTLVDWLVEKYPQIRKVGDDPATRPGIVHRLDKETSGIMLAAKTQPYFEYLKSLFQKHEIKKTYQAVVWGVPKKKEGTIDAPIGIVSGTLRRSVHSTKMKKEAITKYKVLRMYGMGQKEVTLLEVSPLTGRTHQIRVHLASIGHPILGDRLYGPRPAREKILAPSRLMLHALSIEFPNQDGSIIQLSTASPFQGNG